MIKYDELEILLNKATSINFSAMYRGIKFAVDWEQNPDLVSYAKIIQRIGIPVLIQRKFNEGKYYIITGIIFIYYYFIINNIIYRYSKSR